MNTKNTNFKNSGIAWIGEIPKHWGVKKLKFIIENSISGEVIDKGYWNSGNEFLYTCQKEPMFSDFDKFPENKRTRGNCLLLTRNATPYIFIPKDNAIFSNVVQKIILFKKYDKRYIKYSIQIGANSLLVNGDIIPSYNMQVWNNIYFCDIPLDEQERIAGFLDKKCASIDSSIENLEQKTKSLAEYKKALITQCVTKGLNPKNMEFKDSQIPWIGQIPKHWEISKIKYYFNFSSGLNITKENLIESGIPVISYGQIHSKENTGTFIKDSFFRFISQDYLKNKKSLVNKGNFIFADTSEDLDGAGNSVFVDLDLTMFAGYHTIILKNKCNFEFSKFLSYLFQTDLWRSQIRLAVSGVKVFSITKKILANCEILVPPLTEQEKIAGFLDKKCEKIDRLNENYTKQIATLKEYKKSLIYECVTGKKEI